MSETIKYKDYVASLHYSNEDEVFYGKIRGIDDSVTFEGKSVRELKKAFKDAAEDYISLCKKTKKTPLRSYKGNFNVRVKPETHKQAAYRAAELGISLNQFVEQALINSLPVNK